MAASISSEPNEPFRFGWIVEIDPWDPESTPAKRTALGRFRHEGATFGYSPSGRVVFYTGDDERFEYAYKYVSDHAYDPLKRGFGQGLLDEGTLYVATFNDDGTGDWNPLIYGEGPLTPANGFHSQGDVLIKTRMASDLVGATRMDRPEDFEQNPATHKIYLALTNNTQRTAVDTNEPNPRADNAWGHVIELTEADDDAASTSFTWDIFLLCGDPEDPSTYFAGFDKSQVSPISCPDNLSFDRCGNLFIATDGAPGTWAGIFSPAPNDAIHVLPVEGPSGATSSSCSRAWSPARSRACSSPTRTGCCSPRSSTRARARRWLRRPARGPAARPARRWSPSPSGAGGSVPEPDQAW